MTEALHRTKEPATPYDGARYSGPRPHTRDWRRGMSDNVAYALLVYTALQIFVTVHAMKEIGASILPYLALVVLVAGIIPACRWFEKRWRNLSHEEASDPALAPVYRRDRLLLWGLAIVLPLALTALFRGIAAVA
ncbi:hypothetical protein [Pelagerythrobacter sp.]|uniref:hypothetical protein n=1 Tax=Pelagerythrobacter sp. TaxID=2800702 RepID=UPI0035AE9422